MFGGFSFKNVTCNTVLSYFSFFLTANINESHPCSVRPIPPDKAQSRAGRCVHLLFGHWTSFIGLCCCCSVYNFPKSDFYINWQLIFQSYFSENLIQNSVLYVITFVVSCFVCCAQLKQLGHSVDKVEFIVMGGTFMALPEDYRDYFIRNLHDALSGHTSNNVAEAVRYQVTQ